MRDLRRRLVVLFSAVAILMAVVVLPGCKGDSGTQKPKEEPNKTTAPAK